MGLSPQDGLVVHQNTISDTIDWSVWLFNWSSCNIVVSLSDLPRHPLSCSSLWALILDQRRENGGEDISIPDWRGPYCVDSDDIKPPQHNQNNPDQDRKNFETFLWQGKTTIKPTMYSGVKYKIKMNSPFDIWDCLEIEDKIVLSWMYWNFCTLCVVKKRGWLGPSQIPLPCTLHSIVKTWVTWCDQVSAGLIYYHCYSVSALQSSRLEWADSR